MLNPRVYQSIVLLYMIFGYLYTCKCHYL